jgi:iron complex outermembrane recepter protein
MDKHSLWLLVLTLFLLQLVVALLFTSHPAFAELSSERESEVLELLKEEETVSISARYEEPISDAASNVYVITDDDIRQSGATDIPTVLRRVPGMEVMQTTAAEFNVSVRGDNQLNANKLLVLVDGRSIYVDAQGTVLWRMIPVTLPEIKRIEVLKGPASAVYGFNAFDGVVNIITKSPEEMKGTTVQVGYGEFGTLTSSAINAGKHGKLGYRLSVGRDQAQEWRNRDALGFRAHKFNVETQYAISNVSKLIVSGGLVDANRFDGPLVGAAVVGSTNVQGYANVVYERPNFFIRSWWNRHSSDAEQSFHRIANLLGVVTPNGTSVLTLGTNTYNVESQHTLEFLKFNRFSYGINYRHIDMSGSFTVGGRQENRLGFYVQNEFRPSTVFAIVAGARYDIDTFVNPTISPRFAFIYHPVRDHSFRVSFSIAYRPPTLLETTLVQQLLTMLPAPFPSPPPIDIRGSDNLRPEKIASYELAYQGWFLRHRLRLRADLFFNHISDLIDTSNFGPTITFVNGKEADIYGGEAGVEFLASRWLSGFANFSYQEIHQSFTGDIQRGGPQMKGNAGLRGEWDNGLNSEVAYHHYGAATYPISGAFDSFAPLGVVHPGTTVGSYDLVSVRLGYSFWREKAEVAVSAFNALNDRHKEHPLGDTIGSRVMGWLTLKF